MTVLCFKSDLVFLTVIHLSKKEIGDRWHISDFCAS